MSDPLDTGGRWYRLALLHDVRRRALEHGEQEAADVTTPETATAPDDTERADPAEPATTHAAATAGSARSRGT